MPSISITSNATDMSFRSPRRATVLERARSFLGSDNYNRPADLIKAQMRQQFSLPQNYHAPGARSKSTIGSEKVSLPEILHFNAQLNHAKNYRMHNMYSNVAGRSSYAKHHDSN